MAENYDVGGAIGLQTRAIPYRGTPITTGLRIGENNALRQAQQELKKAAKEKEANNKLLSMMNYAVPNVHRQLQGEVQNLGAQTTLGIMNASSPVEAAQIKQNFRQKAAQYMADSDHLKALEQEVNDPNRFSYPKVTAGIKSQTLEGRQKALSSITPEEQTLLGDYMTIDNSNPDHPLPSTNAIPKINLAKQSNEIVQKLTGLADPVLVKKLDNNQFAQFKQDVSPENLAHVAQNEIHNDPNLITNVLGNNMDDAVKELKILNSNPQTADLSDHEKRSIIATKLLTKTYQDVADTWTKNSLRSLKQDNSLVVGNGSAHIGNQVYNYDTTNPNQAKVVYEALGIPYNGTTDLKLGDTSNLPSVSPPAVASGNVQGKNGTVYLDNIKTVYVPHVNKWVALGTNKKGIEEGVVIDNTSAGSVAALYKQPTATFAKVLQGRLDQDGIKAKVDFGGNSATISHNKKTGKTNVSHIFGK